MKIKSSPQLLAFYRWWLENKDEVQALKMCGLCSSAANDYPGGGHYLNNELIAQFKKAGLSNGYPFGSENYNTRQSRDTMHLDPLRIAWVKARIADMED